MKTTWPSQELAAAAAAAVSRDGVVPAVPTLLQAECDGGARSGAVAIERAMRRNATAAINTKRDVKEGIVLKSVGINEHASTKGEWDEGGFMQERGKTCRNRSKRRAQMVNEHTEKYPLGQNGIFETEPFKIVPLPRSTWTAVPSDLWLLFMYAMATHLKTCAADKRWARGE